MIQIDSQRPSDGSAIEHHLDLTFGPARRQRPSYRLRDGIEPIGDLCFVARDDGRLVGTVRFWPVIIDGDRPALLLGPLSVAPDHRHQGIATALVGHGLEAARARGHNVVIAVGDLGFFARFGFRRAHDVGLAMPMPVDLARFLVLDLMPGALESVSGLVGRADAPPDPAGLSGLRSAS